MTQLDSQQDTQKIISSNDNLPAEQAEEFVQSGGEKVQLDLDDAPFLIEEQEAKKEEDSTSSAIAKNPADDAAGEVEEPKSKKKLIIIASAILILLLAGAGAFFFFSGGEKEVDVILQNIIVVPTPPAEDIPTNLQVKLEPFWIDLKNDSSGAQFLVGTFIITVETRSLLAEIKLNLKVVRDAIYYYLINTDTQFLTNHENAQEIRTGIREIINQYMVSGDVTEIYFDSFLMK